MTGAPSSSSVLTPAFTYAAKLERIVDADTLDVELDLGMRVFVRTRLRLAHVDAPELYTEAGKAAKAFVEARMPLGAQLVVRTWKPDKYGRALADVEWSGGRLAEVLAREGHAVPYEGGSR